ncbi:MAG: hypothetical protein LBQ08_00425 [Holosporaceae bacterium]|nr:hypothetical protein [Holosporaceae bacterium]
MKKLFITTILATQLLTAEAMNVARRHTFTPEEDQNLKLLVAKLEYENWEGVAKNMPGRSVRQVRERWKHYLSGTNKNSFSIEDDQILLEKVATLGPKWTKITAFFPGRTDLQIKSRYYQLLAQQEPKFYSPRLQALNAINQGTIVAPLAKIELAQPNDEENPRELFVTPHNSEARMAPHDGSESPRTSDLDATINSKSVAPLARTELEQIDNDINNLSEDGEFTGIFEDPWVYYYNRYAEKDFL